MSEYKAGTVAVATVRRVIGVRVLASTNGDWRSDVSVGGTWAHGPDDVTDIRPLVVLDLADYDADVAPQALRSLTEHLMGPGTVYGRVARSIADQIEAQNKPPKPPEPTGLGAVVEEVHGQRWVWAGDETEGGEHLYVKVNSSDGLHAYASLDVTKVLSEGVPS